MANIKLPTYWSSKQALAVYELLDDIQSLIWRVYSEELIMEEMQTQKDTMRESFETHDFEDEIPF